MGRQAHDIGEQKRARAQRPLDRALRRFRRLRRAHPGPLPMVLQTFSSWERAGKPRRVRGEPE